MALKLFSYVEVLREVFRNFHVLFFKFGSKLVSFWLASLLSFCFLRLVYLRLALNLLRR